jgi:predicted dinucleotide-binding enzyme
MQRDEMRENMSRLEVSGGVGAEKSVHRRASDLGWERVDVGGLSQARRYFLRPASAGSHHRRHEQ